MIFIPYEYVFLLVASLPGIYLATRKNFIYTKNEKYNLFIIRLLFAVPVPLFVNAMISSIIAMLFIWVFPGISSLFISIMDNYASALVPLVFGLILIVLLKKYALPERGFKIIEEKNNIEYDLYLFSPATPHLTMPGGRTLGTEYEIINPKRGNNELPIPSQKTDLIADFRYLKGEYLMMTHDREIVVSNEALEIFKEKDLSGYVTQPVKKYNSSSIYSKSDMDDNHKYKQLICTHIMPKMSPLTVLESQKFLKQIDVLHIQYNRQVLSEITDFNQTFEYFGSMFFSYRYWVLTKKARDVLVNQLNLDKKIFKPVRLVDDETEISLKNEKLWLSKK